jgi:hypothetical protein
MTRPHASGASGFYEPGASGFYGPRREGQPVTRTGGNGGLLDDELMASLFPDRQVVRATLDDRIVDAVFQLNVAEHERRSRLAIGPMYYQPLLRWLADLPEGPQPDPALGAETSMLPAGVIAWSASGHLDLLLEPPLVLDAVVVPAIGQAQTRHVRVADHFAPYASRWVISADPRVDPSVLVAASVNGVGLVTRWPEPEVIASAAPPVGRPLPGLAWLLAEQAYGAWLAAGSRVDDRSDDDTAATGLIHAG